MKKTTSALLGVITLCISTLLPLYYVFELHQESKLTTSSLTGIPSDNGSEITIKIPIALPYATDWEKPRDSEGLFQYGDKFYTLVSKTYESDTLYITALENSNAKDIFNMLSEHFESSSDTQDVPQDQNAWLSKLLQNTLYKQDHFRTAWTVYSHENKLRQVYAYQKLLYLSPALGLNTPPPDFM